MGVTSSKEGIPTNESDSTQAPPSRFLKREDPFIT